ncbi:uncharacterized protein N7496_012343 [Penicillium cataractarum]|uniref:DUF7721 domain-containing protein n=1 Tax=Penicillium cataractarum TaxID=2100454 RepID=A0A9W9R7Q1_9EURO|nr:uncharacterized protein N7496_012343 [Penicillium cataractarum]KAJ5355131.1 hypothetical protein N7496_012343 [Penicillium cataractarum]
MASRDYYNEGNSYDEGSSGRRDEGRNQGYNNEGRNESYGRDEGRNQGYSNDSYNRDDRRHGDMNDTRYSGNQQYSGGDDFSSAAQHAQSHHSSEDSSLFSSALSFLNERKGQFQDPSRIEVDEQHAVQAHNAMYNGGGNEEGRSHDSSTVGAGAAMQALKMFTSGGSSDGGMDKNKLIGLAMAQAGKLWEEKQGAGASMSGDKQSAVNSAAEMALKMYMKGQGGGSGTGSASGLMSLASKFLS